MKTLTEILDLVIDSFQRGEPIEKIVASYPAQAEQLRALLDAAAAVDALPPVEFPSPPALRADRNDFLLQVALLQVEPVSAGPLNRLKEWMVHLQSWQFPAPPIQRKERWKMSTVVVTLTLVAALLMGSLGGVSAMTRDLLPDSPLYGVKLLAEEAVLLFTPDPERRAEQHLALAQERLREVEQFALAGEVPGDATLARLEQHLALALRYADDMETEAQQAFLLRARQMLTAQEQQVLQLEGDAGEPVQVALRAAQRILHQTGAEIDTRLEGGPGEPAREQLRMQSTPEAPLTPSLVPSRFRNQGTSAPADTCEACTPVGDEHKYGQADVDQPGPGAPGGNEDGTCEDCEPVGDQNQVGPQPEQPGSEQDNRTEDGADGNAMADSDVTQEEAGGGQVQEAPAENAGGSQRP